MNKQDMQRFKNNTITAANDAKDAYAHKYGRANIDSKEAEILVNDGKYFQDEIDLTDRVLEVLQDSNAHNVAGLRKYVLGAKAYRIYQEEAKKISEIKVRTGQRLSQDETGAITKREKKIIVAAKKEIAQAKKVSKEQYKRLGKGKDHEGVKLSSYVKRMSDEFAIKMSAPNRTAETVARGISKEISGHEFTFQS